MPNSGPPPTPTPATPGTNGMSSWLAMTPADGGGWSTRRGARFAWLALFVVLFCVPLFLGLGRTDLSGDEAIYSFGTVRVLETNDWLFPKSSPHEDAAFLEKPPLKFWIVAAGIRSGLLPNNEFGLRFWDALFGSLAFLYVFAIGRRMGGPLAGTVAVLVLVVQQPLLFDHGLRSNNMEGPLFLAYCGGVYHYLRWTAADAPASRWGHIAAVAAYFFLGFMTKFVAVAFLPLVLMTTTMLVPAYRAKVVRDWWRWVLAFAAAVALAAPWFIVAHLRYGNEFWTIILAEHVYRRFTAYLNPDHVQPWYFYFLELYRNVEASFAMSLALPGFVVLAARTIRQRWPEGVLVLVWGLLPLGLMSMTTSKLIHYAYPFFPPAALAAGCFAPWLLETIQPRFVGLMQVFERRTAAGGSRALKFLHQPVVRFLLLALAAACVVLAVATILYGHVRVSIGDVFLFRTSGVLRPWLVAMLLAILAGWPVRIARLGIPLLFAGLLPFNGYMDVVNRALIERHPLRTVRDCMLTVRAGSAPGTPLGMFVDETAPVLRHEDYFYFRRIRPMERTGVPADARLFDALFIPGRQRPVLLPETLYREFRAKLRGADARTLDGLMKNAGEAREQVLAQGFTDPPRMIDLPLGLLLLPGPYSVCSGEDAGHLSRRLYWDGESPKR